MATKCQRSRSDERRKAMRLTEIAMDGQCEAERIESLADEAENALGNCFKAQRMLCERMTARFQVFAGLFSGENAARLLKIGDKNKDNRLDPKEASDLLDRLEREAA